MSAAQLFDTQVRCLVMSDLKSPVADRAQPGREGTTPVPVARVTGGGQQRRRPRLAAVVTGAALAGLVAAGFVFALRPGSVPAAPAPSSARRACTEQVTLAVPAGQMRACVDYRYARNRLEVLAAGASYTSVDGYDLPYFTFTFRDPSTGAVDYTFSIPVYHYENVFSRHTGLIDLASRAAGKRIHAGDVLQVSLRAFNNEQSVRGVQMAGVTLTLYPLGLWCPDLGPGATTDEGTGQC
jgi:hypothetical protein